MAIKKKVPPQPRVIDEPDEPTSPPRGRPLVFISHDTRDADIAEAFADLLQDASGGVLHSFRSSDRKGTSGIEFGAEWYVAIMERLKDATDVVALLTEQSLGRPWLLYEAGVAKGRLDTVVFGLAVGVPLDRASIGPFAQFQNSSDDEDSLTKLVLQLIRRNPDANPREEAVRRQVVAFRASTEELLRKRPKQGAAGESSDLSPAAVAKLFEEIKVMFRQLPDQLEHSIERRLATSLWRAAGGGERSDGLTPSHSEGEEKPPLASHPVPALQQLTPLETFLAQQLMQEKDLATIGDELNLSRSTVRTYAVGIYSKYGARTRSQFMQRFRSNPLPSAWRTDSNDTQEEN